MSIRRLAVVLLLLSLGLAACGEDEPSAQETDEPTADATVSEEDAAAILDNLGEFQDEEVTVTTAVAETFGKRAVIVYSHATSGDKVLVVTDEDISLSEGDIVEITGTVREFDADEVTERDVDPADPAYEPYFGDLVVMAEEVDVLQQASGG